MADAVLMRGWHTPPAHLSKPSEEVIAARRAELEQNTCGWVDGDESEITQFIASAYGIEQHTTPSSSSSTPLAGGKAAEQEQGEELKELKEEEEDEESDEPKDTACPAWLKLRKYRITGTRAPCVLGLGYDSAKQLIRKLDAPFPAYARKFCQSV